MLGIVLGIGDIGLRFGAHEAYILGARGTTSKEFNDYTFLGDKKVITKYKGKREIENDIGGKQVVAFYQFL